MVWVDWLRWVNALMGGVGFFWLVIRSTDRWDTYDPPIRLVIYSLAFYVFASATGAAEAALQHIPPAIRVYEAFFANSFLLATLWFTQKNRTKTKTL